LYNFSKKSKRWRLTIAGDEQQWKNMFIHTKGLDCYKNVKKSTEFFCYIVFVIVLALILANIKTIVIVASKFLT